VPEGSATFYYNDRAHRPAALIQDQPRGLFTDFLIIFNKDRSLPAQNNSDDNNNNNNNNNNDNNNNNNNNNNKRIREWEENKQLPLDLVLLTSCALI